MLHTLAIENYRSLRSVVVPLGKLNVIKGVNGSGKSNLYKALRLLADAASGGIVSSLAREGGLKSTFWAGPEKVSREMRTGRVPVQGTLHKKPVRLKLGFSGDDFELTKFCGRHFLPTRDGPSALLVRTFPRRIPGASRGSRDALCYGDRSPKATNRTYSPQPNPIHFNGRYSIRPAKSAGSYTLAINSRSLMHWPVVTRSWWA